MLALIAALLLPALSAATRPIALPYNSAQHTLTLFAANGAPLLLAIAFDSPDLSLH